MSDRDYPQNSSNPPQAARATSSEQNEVRAYESELANEAPSAHDSAPAHDSATAHEPAQTHESAPVHAASPSASPAPAHAAETVTPAATGTSSQTGALEPGPAVPAAPQASLRQEVLEREKEEFGGVKIGSAFFGWLTATGTAVILTALVAATGAAIGLGITGDADAAADEGVANADTVGIVGAIALLVVILVAYYCGGYVAGRMARFNGIKQGVAVWLWAIVIAIVVAIITAIAGSQYNVLGNLNSFPRIPIDEGDLTTASVITAILVAVVSLIGAILGGLGGMRFHRKVDRAGLGR